MAYLLKARTVEAEKQPLLGNAGTTNRAVTIRDAYSRFYIALAAYACAVTSRNNSRGVASGVLCGSDPRLHDSIDRVQFRESECSAVEDAVMECLPAAN
jgi:hypothetical protein